MKNLNALKTRCLKKEGRKLFTRLNVSVKAATKTCSEPDIHQMRVVIKKWRAFLEAAKFTKQSKNHKKFSKPYRKLFSVSGNIRDAQVHALFLQEHHLADQLQPYLQHLKEEEESSKRQLKAVYKSLQKKKLLGKRIKQLNTLLSQMTDTGVAAYTAACIEKAKQYIAGSYTDEEQLHQLRKLLKQWQYNAILLQNCGFDQTGGKNLVDFLVPFNELLGKWQDTTVALDYLNELQNGQQPAINPKAMVKLQKEIATAKATLQRTIMAGLLDLSILLAKME